MRKLLKLFSYGVSVAIFVTAYFLLFREETESMTNKRKNLEALQNDGLQQVYQSIPKFPDSPPQKEETDAGEMGENVNNVNAKAGADLISSSKSVKKEENDMDGNLPMHPDHGQVELVPDQKVDEKREREKAEFLKYMKGRHIYPAAKNGTWSGIPCFVETIIKLYHEMTALNPGAESILERGSDQSLLDWFDAEQKRRHRHIEKTCSILQQSIKFLKATETTWDFYFNFNLKHKIIWCTTGKTGTTTWANIFLQLFGFPADSPPNKPKVWGRTKRDLQKINMTKKEVLDSLLLPNPKTRLQAMMISRHPLERLLSSFRDKIAPRGMLVEGVNTDFDKKVTFSDFFNWSSLTKVFNPHWSPAIMYCNPCKHFYKYVLAMETFDDDTRAVLKRIDADYVVLQHLRQTIAGNSTDAIQGGRKSKFERDKTRYRAILRHVPASALQAFVTRFLPDFILFGYDVRVVLELIEEKLSEEPLSS